MQDSYTAYQYNIKEEFFVVHGEEGLAHQQQLAGEVVCDIQEHGNVAAGSSSGRHQHAKEQKRREQSSDVKRHFFAAAKQVKVARRRV
jgi:hypothetical protein